MNHKNEKQENSGKKIANITSIVATVIAIITVAILIRQNIQKPVKTAVLEQNNTNKLVLSPTGLGSIEADSITTEARSVTDYFYKYYYIKDNAVLDFPKQFNTMYFSATNENNVDVVVSDIIVEVTKYEPYDDYLFVLVMNEYAGAEPYYLYYCKISPKIGEYTAEMKLSGIDGFEAENPTYVKIEANGGTEGFGLALDSDTPGIYTINIKLQYGIKRKLSTVEVDSDLTYVQPPDYLDIDMSTKALAAAFSPYYSDTLFDYDDEPTYLTSYDDVTSFIRDHYPNVVKLDQIVIDDLKNCFENGYYRD